MFDKGFFGGLFDFDRDGKLDSLERAMDFGLFCKMMEDCEKEENEEEDEEEEE